ncbi:hypothetical protein ACLMJK_006531 [Lecanora helva]
MDMQGTPIGSSAQGMKVSKYTLNFPPFIPQNLFFYLKYLTNPSKQHTTDPEALNNPKIEGAGAVASDSLAAESARSGGKFGDNRDSQPLKQSGSSSTFNNTDISGATTLAPAPDAGEREAQSAYHGTDAAARGVAGQKYPEGAGGQGDIQGQPMDGKPASGLRGVTGPSASMGSTGGDNANPAPTANTFQSRNESSGNRDVDAAPGYVASVVSDPAQIGKPKGKNITEGGFEQGDEQNASFNSEIGSKDDPGRRAENDFQRMTQSASGSTAPRQKMGEGDRSQYDVLETEQGL